MNSLYITNKIKIEDFAEIMNNFKLVLVQDIIPHIKKVYSEELYEYYVEDIFRDCYFQINQNDYTELVIKFIKNHNDKEPRIFNIIIHYLMGENWKDKIIEFRRKEQVQKREDEYRKKKNEMISRAEKYCYYKKLEKDFESQPLTEGEKKIAINISTNHSKLKE